MTTHSTDAGIACPRCRRTRSSVYRSQRRPGVVQRTRACDNCGRRWLTRESTVGEIVTGDGDAVICGEALMKTLRGIPPAVRRRVSSEKGEPEHE